MELRIKFGQTGTNGRQQIIVLDSTEAAKRELKQRIASKIRNGYMAIGQATAPSKLKKKTRRRDQFSGNGQARIHWPGARSVFAGELRDLSCGSYDYKYQINDKVWLYSEPRRGINVLEVRLVGSELRKGNEPDDDFLFFDENGNLLWYVVKITAAISRKFAPNVLERKSKRKALLLPWPDKKIPFKADIIEERENELICTVIDARPRYEIAALVESDNFNNLLHRHEHAAAGEGIAWADGLVPRRLQKQMNAMLDQMALQEPADYHPGSGVIVRDFVHPSLYCFVWGLSQVTGDFATPEPKRSRSKRGTDYWGREYEDSKYQWLPTPFFVGAGGKVSILAYINNLDKVKYRDLYGAIGNLFSIALPLLEAVYAERRTDFFDWEKKNRQEIFASGWSPEVSELKRAMERRLERGKEYPHGKGQLRNRELQVITKIVEYRVGEETEFDGVWHVEGMSHENIMATVVYVLERSENFQGADIHFQRRFLQSEGDGLSRGPQYPVNPIYYITEAGVVPLGKIDTPRGRLLVFPNSHIHKLSSMRSTNDQDAVRRIILFWLVNPETPILSTREVAPQQAYVPREVAEANRLKLMEERKRHKENLNIREFNLCEH